MPADYEIVIVTPEYAADGYTGGMGMFYRRLTTAFREAGFTVVVISSSHFVQHSDAVVGHIALRNWGERLWRLNRAFGTMPSSLAASAQAARCLRRCAGPASRRVVLVPDFGGWGLLVKLLNPRHPVVLRLHGAAGLLRARTGALTSPRHHFLSDNLERASLAYADGITAPSEFMAHVAADFYRIPRDRIHVIPNLFVAQPPPAPIRPTPSKERLILLVGRVERTKGAHLVPAVVQELVRAGEDFQLAVIGNDTLSGTDGKSMTAQMRRELGLEAPQRCVFHGRLPFAQVEQFYQRASIVLIPSLFESFSNAALEAIHHRCLVVASEGTAAADIVAESGCGAVVRFADATATAARIATLLATHAEVLQSCQTQRQAFLNRCSPKQVVAALCNLFERLRRDKLKR